MVSTATTRNRLEKQGTGDNTGTWGTKLNTATIDLIDAALDGRTTFTLSGSKTLTSTNYAADESRMRFIDITSGSGGTVTIPSLEKWYLVRNAASGAVTFTTGSGTTVEVASNDTALIVSDGTNVRSIGASVGYVTEAIAAAALSSIPGIPDEVVDFLVAPSSTNLRLAVTGETGTGGLVFDTSPTLSGASLGGATDLTGSTRQTIVAVSALDIDCSAGNYFTKTINGNSTFTFSNPPASRAYAFTLELTHTSGTITWPASVTWPGDLAPVLVTGKTHLFIFVTDDGGSRWRGVVQRDYVN